VWLTEKAPLAVRWRVRAAADGSQALWSTWQMFGRSRSQTGASVARSRPAGERAAAPSITSPKPGAYDADIPVDLAPPSGRAVSGYVVAFSSQPPEGGDWSEATESPVPAAADGTGAATLPLSWLAQQAPGAVQWRIRARVDGDSPGPWSEWVVFSIVVAATPSP